MQHALRNQRRFAEIARELPAGPLQARMEAISRQVDGGVDACWAVAQRGHHLEEARRTIDAARVQRELAALGPGEGPIRARTRASLQAQLDAAARLDITITGSREQLRLLDAHLTEAVARAAELSVTGPGGSAAVPSDLEGVADDITQVTAELESLRGALDELNQPRMAPGGLPSGGTAGSESPWPGGGIEPAPIPPRTEPTNYPPGSGYPPASGYPPSEGYPPASQWSAPEEEPEPRRQRDR